MFGGAFMRPEWGKDGSGQSPSERLFKLRLKATSAFTTSYYPRAFSGRFEAELRCTDTIGILKKGRNIKYLPHVFTQECVTMLSSALRSPHAVHSLFASTG